MSISIAPTAATDGLIPAKGAGLVRIWLLVVAAMVYAMILVGGATRLTDSGLSITEWKPLLGAVPPMNEHDWAEAFAKYRSMTAQASQLNFDMDISGFKAIYWWEWSHRELGRLIGVVFALPLIVFWVMGRVTKKLLPRLIVLFCMGGLQGLIGWWMVASGVNSDLTSVAPERLMTHFGLALAIIAYCIWLWHDLGASRREVSREAGGWASALIWIAGVQMLLGALVAGLDAGRGYTDWPLMAGRFVPEAMWRDSLGLRNFIANDATVQFLHRMTAYALLIVSAVAAWRLRADKLGFVITLALVLAQGALGVWTLVHAAPLNLSLLHQALGTVVLLSCVRMLWKTRVRLPQPADQVASANAG